MKLISFRTFKKYCIQEMTCGNVICVKLNDKYQNTMDPRQLCNIKNCPV